MKKELEVRQRDAKDCGVCSLLSIIKYYKGYVSLEKIRIDTHTDNDGTTFFHLLNAAKQYGFEGTGVQITISDLLNGEVIFPVIAHLVLENSNTHFVVVYKVSDKYIWLMDPAYGLVRKKLFEFDSVWSKRILILRPINQIIKMRKDENILVLLTKILPEEKALVLKIILTSIIFTFLSIISSFYFKFAIEDFEKYGINNSFILISIIFLMIYLLKIFLNYVKDYLENYLNRNIDIRVIFPFIKHIFLLPLNIVKSRSTGELTSRINDLNHIKNLFSKIFVTISLDLFLAFLSMFVLFNINSTLFLILIIVLVCYLLIGVLCNSFIYKKIIQNINYETDFNSTLIESVDSVVTIKNNHNYQYFFKKIENKFYSYLKDSFIFNEFINRQNFLRNFISEIGLFFVNVVGVYLIINNKITFLNLVTFNTLMIYLFDPVKNLIDLLPSISHLKATLAKVSEFANLDAEDFNNSNTTFVNGDIEIKNLKYSYNDYNFILNDLSFRIVNKSKVFISGISGSGKSTLCKLLYRLYDIKHGSIKINNINILDYDLNTIRNNITYLSQKEDLFNANIKDNIIFDKKVNLSKLWKIIELCEIEDIINKKELRLEALLLESGHNLSGGEKQRILLARALLKDSSIIILDEVLSEVEEAREKRIIKNILKEYNDKTIIYISHRNNGKLFENIIDFENLNHA